MTDRKRDHSKCQNAEKLVTDFFTKKMYNKEIINFDFINGDYKVTQILKKDGKNDTKIECQKINTDEYIKIGIQTKLTNNVFVENWLKYEKFENLDLDLIRDITTNPIMITNFRNRLISYRKGSGRHNARFNKLALCIHTSPEKDIENIDGIEVTDINLKKRFIKGENNKVDYFLYYIGDGNNIKTESFKLITDEYYKDTKLYYRFRPIYNTSGDTQLKQPDILGFDKLFSEYIIRRINRILNLNN
jgi:hypothetical protein